MKPTQAEIDKLDAYFEKMSRGCAESMTGTHPPKPKKTGVKRKGTKKKK